MAQRFLTLDMVENRLRRWAISNEQVERHLAQLKHQRELRKEREALRPPKQKGSVGRKQ